MHIKQETMRDTAGGSSSNSLCPSLFCPAPSGTSGRHIPLQPSTLWSAHLYLHPPACWTDTRFSCDHVSDVPVHVRVCGCTCVATHASRMDHNTAACWATGVLLGHSQLARKCLRPFMEPALLLPLTLLPGTDVCVCVCVCVCVPVSQCEQKLNE